MNQKIQSRKKAIALIAVYLVWLFVHALLEGPAICLSVAGFDGRHFSAFWAFIWPPMLIVLIVAIVKRQELLLVLVAAKNGQLSFGSRQNLLVILILAFIVAILIYSGFRAANRFDAVQSQLQSEEWPVLQEKYCR